jgi:CBS domain-containing protein
MVCYLAIEKKGVTLSPDTTVEEALKLLKKSKSTVASVVDGDGVFIGVFSMGILLKNLIPVPITTSSGVQIDMKMLAIPGVARRLGGVLPLKVTEVIERNPTKVSSDRPMWEAVGRIAAYCEPLCVIDENDKFMGLVTYESLIDELNKSRNA